mgnify:CR=1 FL=1
MELLTAWPCSTPLEVCTLHSLTADPPVLWFDGPRPQAAVRLLQSRNVCRYGKPLPLGQLLPEWHLHRNPARRTSHTGHVPTYRLTPILLPGPRPECDASGGEGTSDGFVVHIADHQYLFGIELLDDGRDQAFVIVLETLCDARVESGGVVVCFVGHDGIAIRCSVLQVGLRSFRGSIQRTVYPAA